MSDAYLETVESAVDSLFPLLTDKRRALIFMEVIHLTEIVANAYIPLMERGVDIPDSIIIDFIRGSSRYLFSTSSKKDKLENLVIDRFLSCFKEERAIISERVNLFSI